jgi:putative PIN family toxin of toxin-antitoxin system
MIRFVPDTNVLVSATITPNAPPGQILVAWIQGKAELATSPILLRELERVLQRARIKKYQQLGPDEIAKLVRLIAQAAVITPGRRRIRVIKDDPSDNHVLSAALEAKADYIVTGDRDLLALRSYRGIKIVQPGEFHAVLERGD